MRLYYLIWVDLIAKAKSQPANKKNWKVVTMIFMTVPMAFDFLFVMILLQSFVLDHYFYEIQIPVIPQKIGRPLGFIILYVCPFILINYILIFRNRRYEKLIKKYKSHDGKVVGTYIAFAMLIPVIALWLAYILQ